MMPSPAPSIEAGRSRSKRVAANHEIELRMGGCTLVRCGAGRESPCLLRLHSPIANAPRVPDDLAQLMRISSHLAALLVRRSSESTRRCDAQWLQYQVTESSLLNRATGRTGMLGWSVVFVVITAILVAAGPFAAFAQSNDHVDGGDELDCGHCFEGAQPDA